MVAENLKLVIQAEVTKAISDLKKFQTTTNDAKSSVGKFQEKILSWVKGMGAAYLSIRTLQMALKYGFEAAQIAADASQVSRALDSMAKSSGMTANQIVQNLKRASGGTIAELELMKSASKAALFDLPMDQMGKLMEIARASATATGESVQFMFDSIVTGIARSSPMILDNLGLTMKVGEATEKYAQSIGKTSDNLTAEERKMATLNAVLESGGKILERVGDAAKDFTDAERVQKYQSSMKDLKMEIGTSLLPAFREVLKVSTDIAESLRESVRAARAFDNIRAGTATLEDQIIAINLQLEQMNKNLNMKGTLPGINMDDWRKQIQMNIESLEKERDALMRQQGAIEFASKMRGEAVKKAIDNAKKEEARIQAQLDFAEKVRVEYLKTAEGQRQALVDAIAYWEKQASAAGAFAPQIVAIVKNLREELIAMDATGESARELVDIWEDLNPDFLKTNDLLPKLTMGFFGLSDGVNKFIDNLNEVRPLTEQEIADYEALANVSIKFNDKLKQQNEYLQSLKKSFAEYDEQLEKAKKSAETMQNAMAPFTDAFGALIVGAEDAGEAMKQAIKGAIAAILEMLAKEALVRAMMAFASLNPVAGAAWTAAGVAAMVAAGAVKAMAEGGVVTKPTMALVGERGPEAVIPLNKSGGVGTTVIVNVQGSVLEEEGLARRITKVMQGAGRGY